VGFFVATAFIILPQGDGIRLGPLGVLSSIPSGRIAAASGALDTILQHPLLGAGVGEPVAHFHHEYAAQGATVHIKDFHLEAHNIYLGLWAQMGPLAFFGFFFAIGTVCRQLLGISKTTTDARHLRAGLFAAVCGQLLYGGLFGGFEDSRHIWMLLGLSITAAISLTDASASPPPDASRSSG
jgi:O-antigen ligase